MSIFNGPPKPKKPPPPPMTPTRADASVKMAGQNDNLAGYSSLINTSAQGLQRKARTTKRSLIGGE
jgi:hypothetical protein